MEKTDQLKQKKQPVKTKLLKKLSSEIADKKTISVEMIKQATRLRRALTFIMDFGSYNTRIQYGLSEKEYRERISKLALEIEQIYMRMIVAEAVISDNGLADLCSKEMKTLCDIIISNSKKITEEKQNENNVPIAEKI